MTYNKDKFITKCYRLMSQYTLTACMINAIQDIIDRANNETITKANVKWINDLYDATQ